MSLNWHNWTRVEGISGIMKIHFMFCLDYREFQHILCNNVLCNNMTLPKIYSYSHISKGNANAPEFFDTELCCLLLFSVKPFFVFLDCSLSGFEMHENFVYILYDSNDFE